MSTPCWPSAHATRCPESWRAPTYPSPPPTSPAWSSAGCCGVNRTGAGCCSEVCPRHTRTDLQRTALVGLDPHPVEQLEAVVGEREVLDVSVGEHPVRTQLVVPGRNLPVDDLLRFLDVVDPLLGVERGPLVVDQAVE